METALYLLGLFIAYLIGCIAGGRHGYQRGWEAGEREHDSLTRHEAFLAQLQRPPQ